MFAGIGTLARLCGTPADSATVETVVEACAAARDLLGAEDAYVIRGGDPHFVRLGDGGDPTGYEIKQRGYWHAWREAVAHPAAAVRLLTVRDRVVEEITPLASGLPATHLAAVLPADGSNSEMLVIYGPWPGGITEDQTELIAAIRPLMAYLVTNVLDAERKDRLRSQMRVLAEVAAAFSSADEHQTALDALATALARASGFAWVAVILLDPAIERVEHRAISRGRHSNTETAARARSGRESGNSVDRDIRVARHVAWTRQPHCVPDISDPGEHLLVDDELRPFYERAHIVSMATFPVYAHDEMLGTITFCASEPHGFDHDETEFLWSLVAQGAPTIKAFRLNLELRQAEQHLRAVFSNAPVFITVVGRDGEVQLVEGAGIRQPEGPGRLAVGGNVFNVLPEASHPGVRSIIRRGLSGEQFEVDMAFDGRHFQGRFAPLRDEYGFPSAVIAVAMDITDLHETQTALRTANRELQAAKETAEYLADHDVLTGTLSRRAWFDDARAAGPAAIAIVDVDAFKSVNDRFGHPAGDAVLRAVGERLCGAIGAAGSVGRLGGEEFGVAFHVPTAEAARTCERAVALIGSVPCLLPGGGLLTVTVSAGLAPVREPGSPGIDRAYEEADGALYVAKQRGRHRLVIAPAAA